MADYFAKFYYNNKKGYIQTKNELKEKIGPSGFEKYAFLSSNKSTAPHVDIFKTIEDVYNNPPADSINANIVLSGSTEEYVIDVYGDSLTSLSQYFLKNQTRNGIQYLIFVYSEEGTPKFKAFVPGLLYDSEGFVLGYLHSYVADDTSHKIILELPYTNSTGYTIQGVTNNYTGIENLVELTVYNDSYLSIAKGSHTVQNIELFRSNSTDGTRDFVVKTANEFGDYTVAAQLTENNNIKEVLDVLSKLEERSITLPPKSFGEDPQTVTDYFPKTFLSLINNTPSESVKNITPGIYKVPAAFVQNESESEKIFMTDVIGISANETIYGAIKQ